MQNLNRKGVQLTKRQRVPVQLTNMGFDAFGYAGDRLGFRQGSSSTDGEVEVSGDSSSDIVLQLRQLAAEYDHMEPILNLAANTIELQAMEIGELREKLDQVKAMLGTAAGPRRSARGRAHRLQGLPDLHPRRARRDRLGGRYRRWGRYRQRGFDFNVVGIFSSSRTAAGPKAEQGGARGRRGLGDPYRCFSAREPG